MLISATVIFKSVYNRFMFYLNINEIESNNLKKTQIYFRETWLQVCAANTASVLTVLDLLDLFSFVILLLSL